jgi:uncharacterized protein YdaU (DUF1376 family)
MHFYPHNIADFNNATRHLTRVQRSVYRDAIEHYYDKEKPLDKDLDRLQKRLLCFYDDEKDALNYILDEFFELTEAGYYNERCEREIEKFRANTSAKARAGIASAKARQQKATSVQQVFDICETDEQLTNNQEPITNNQEPLKPTMRKKPRIDDDGLFDQFWQIYPKRVAKDAARKAWLKIQNMDQVWPAIQNALAWQIETDQWSKDGGQYIPNAATYLNQGRWNDDPPSNASRTLGTAGQKTKAAAQRFLNGDGDAGKG